MKERKEGGTQRERKREKGGCFLSTHSIFLFFFFSFFGKTHADQGEYCNEAGQSVWPVGKMSSRAPGRERVVGGIFATKGKKKKSFDMKKE